MTTPQIVSDSLRPTRILDSSKSTKSTKSTESAQSAHSASSEEETLGVSVPEISQIYLHHKPTAKLAYTFYYPSKGRNGKPNPFAQTIMVFLNGLMTPRSTWDPCINLFLEKRTDMLLPYPALLTYDRYGQGKSDRDPEDGDQPIPCHGHDCISAVKDLHQFLQQLWREHLPWREHLRKKQTSQFQTTTHFPALIFVCNSIGSALARLYAKMYPGTVRGLLFLDSVITSSSMVDLFPDPDDPSFTQALPAGVSISDLREARRKFRENHHPDIPNHEGLSKQNLSSLLPSPSSPKLSGYGSKGPYLTVVGHDFSTFAHQLHTSPLKIPPELTMGYINPAWMHYNESLTAITDHDKAIGPIIAIKCGHKIQEDGPEFVCGEMMALIDRVVNRTEQLKESDVNTGDLDRIYGLWGGERCSR